MKVPFIHCIDYNSFYTKSRYIFSSITTNLIKQNEYLFSGEDTDSEVLIVNLMNGNFPKRPRNLLLSVPQDLYAKISTLHGSPPLWWVGQLLAYLWKPQPWLLEDLEKFQEDLKGPIVG